ncbi:MULTISPECIES: HNH endonuclease family protein [Halorubrum]|uniref:HNH endonuclease family protein n=1 Tax=Halorubrum TaxID=56688 RepID=UPI001EF9FF60|nr:MULTISPECIES: HNH endonuclease family protein [Halorubrum]
MYAIDSRRADTGRGRLVRLAHDVHTTPSIDPETVVERLDAITKRYTDDNRFERQLRDPDFYQSTSRRDTKYLLYHYGQAVESEAGEEVLTSPGHIISTEFQVEHVLARKLPADAIPESLVGEFDDHVHRLGNLTLSRPVLSPESRTTPSSNTTISPPMWTPGPCVTSCHRLRYRGSRGFHHTSCYS